MKIAFIGAGSITNRHLNAIKDQPGIEVVGFASPNAERNRNAVAKWGGRAYTGTAALLENESPDAVWVCVPPHQHGETESLLIERGIAIMIEKPLSADRETGAGIAEQITRTGVIAAVGYHWRALDFLPHIRALLAKTPAQMVLGTWHGSTPGPAWWQKQATSGGQMVEQATHIVDIARALLGDATVKASSAAYHDRAAYPDLDVAGVSAALLDFNGIIGSFSATCLLNGHSAANIQLICEGMLITLGQSAVTIDNGQTRRELTPQEDPFLVENRAFLKAVETGDPTHVICDYAEALKTHHVMHDILDQSGYPPEGESE